MRIVFMGTPDFAAAHLQALIDAGHEIPAVYTNPDKPQNRGMKLGFSPVKEVALKNGLSVLQPQTLRDGQAVETLRQLNPDLLAVVAYGKILPAELLSVPSCGAVNVHASLLPKYRGASPIQWTILSGDKEGGVTIQKMAEGLDTGDILLQKSLTLDPEETAGSLFDKLSVLGAELLTETLTKLEDGSVRPEPQKEELATKTGKIDKNFGQLDWKKSGEELERFIRAMDPWPGSFTYLRGKILKVKKAAAVPYAGNEAPGTALSAGKNTFTVRTGDGALSLLLVQLEGKKLMDAGAFLRGTDVQPGEVLKSL
jgi:methionyl-tRNA formyltransferase